MKIWISGLITRKQIERLNKGNSNWKFRKNESRIEYSCHIYDFNVLENHPSA